MGFWYTVINYHFPAFICAITLISLAIAGIAGTGPWA